MAIILKFFNDPVQKVAMIFQLLNVFVDDLMEQIGLGSSKSDTLYFNWIDVSFIDVNVICY